MSNHVVLFDQPWEAWRLALGTFLSSPGAGVLGLLGAAWLAFIGANKRITADRELAVTSSTEEHQRDLDSDARERWQSFYDHLWTNRSLLPAEALILGVQSLAELATTKQQNAMVEVFVAYLGDEAQEALT